MLSLQPPSGVVGGSGGFLFVGIASLPVPFYLQKMGGMMPTHSNHIFITHFPQCRETPANEPLAMLF